MFYTHGSQERVERLALFVVPDSDGVQVVTEPQRWDDTTAVAKTDEALEVGEMEGTFELSKS